MEIAKQLNTAREHCQQYAVHDLRLLVVTHWTEKASFRDKSRLLTAMDHKPSRSYQTGLSPGGVGVGRLGPVRSS
jgi:hypothetical protein